MRDLVQPEDFNAEVVARFLRENGIDAQPDDSTGSVRYKLADPARQDWPSLLRLQRT
jgi:hypothetical protein